MQTLHAAAAAAAAASHIKLAVENLQTTRWKTIISTAKAEIYFYLILLYFISSVFLQISVYAF